MQCVALMLWGDAWSGSQQGYFNIFFYTQDGTGYSQSSGLIYTSFTRTGRLWWDPWMGGQGAVYATIDGVGGPYPLAEVDNASRVIKYVVTSGYRFQSYNLVDLRIHDVDVVADLHRHEPASPNPTEPVEQDGTLSGTSDAEAGKAFVTVLEPIAQAALSLTWSGWWPVLRITAALLYNALRFNLVLELDLLGSMSVQSCSFTHPILDTMTEQQQDTALNNAYSLPNILGLQMLVLVSAFAAQFFATFQLLPYAKIAFTIAVLAWTSISLSLIYLIADYFLRGLLDKVSAAWALFTIGFGLFLAGHTISRQGIFGRVFSFLNKYRVDVIEPWGYHDTFLTCSRVLVFLLCLPVIAAILMS